MLSSVQGLELAHVNQPTILVTPLVLLAALGCCTPNAGPCSIARVGPGHFGWNLVRDTPVVTALERSSRWLSLGIMVSSLPHLGILSRDRGWAGSAER